MTFEQDMQLLNSLAPAMDEAADLADPVLTRIEEALAKFPVPVIATSDYDDTILTYTYINNKWMLMIRRNTGDYIHRWSHCNRDEKFRALLVVPKFMDQMAIAVRAAIDTAERARDIVGRYFPEAT